MTERLPLRADDPAYVRYQYADDEKLRIRKETHQRYSEGTGFQEWVVSQVAARPGQSLLDVGSGTGDDYHPLFDDVDIVAMDLSPGMLAKVRVKRVNADAQSLPFADRTFDRVMSNHMLYHVPDKVRALREMKRVAKPGGRVVITANSRHSYANLWALRNEAIAELGLPEYYGVGHWFALEDVIWSHRSFKTRAWRSVAAPSSSPVRSPSSGTSPPGLPVWRPESSSSESSH